MQSTAQRLRLRAIATEFLVLITTPERVWLKLHLHRSRIGVDMGNPSISTHPIPAIVAIKVGCGLSLKAALLGVFFFPAYEYGSAIRQEAVSLDR